MGRDGYTSLTLRSLAEELGVSPSALYTYVDAIGEVEEKALRSLTDRLSPPRSSTGPELRDEFKAHLLSSWELMRLHPGVLLAKPGSAASEKFRELAQQWQRALLPHVPDRRALDIAVTALAGTLLLMVEAERLLETGSSGKSRKASPQKTKPFTTQVTSELVESYINDLMNLLLPGMAAGSRGRKSASRRSKK